MQEQAVSEVLLNLQNSVTAILFRLNEDHLKFIREIIEKDSSATLGFIQGQVHSVWAINIGKSTVQKYLKDLNGSAKA